jgi:hypothetical protein
MLSVTKESILKPEAVIQRAVKFFGPNGVGLKIMEQDNCNAVFEGGGGSVRVTAATTAKGSKVDIETREWESQTKDFLFTIK